MTSRERVRLSLNHREPDMVPIDFGAMRSAGINAVAYYNLKKHLNINYGETEVYDIFQQLAEPEKEIAGLFGADVVQLHRYEPAFGINISCWKDGELFDRITKQYIEDLEKYLDAVAPFIDIIQMVDDLGTQENLQISVKMYRDMIKPYHTRLCRYVRDNYPDVKVFLHSCGAVSELIDDLIEAGIEILNPVQISDRGMDPDRLKKRYGNHITFRGGGVDTQTTLTNGSLEDIRREVKEMMRIFSPGGGYVFTQVHNIQPNISPEKIVTVYKTAQKYRNY